MNKILISARILVLGSFLCVSPSHADLSYKEGYSVDFTFSGPYLDRYSLLFPNDHLYLSRGSIDIETTPPKEFNLVRLDSVSVNFVNSPPDLVQNSLLLETEGWNISAPPGVNSMSLDTLLQLQLGGAGKFVSGEPETNIGACTDGFRTAMPCSDISDLKWLGAAFYQGGVKFSENDYFNNSKLNFAVATQLAPTYTSLNGGTGHLHGFIEVSYNYKLENFLSDQAKNALENSAKALNAYAQYANVTKTLGEYAHNLYTGDLRNIAIDAASVLQSNVTAFDRANASGEYPEIAKAIYSNVKSVLDVIINEGTFAANKANVLFAITGASVNLAQLAAAGLDYLAMKDPPRYDYDKGPTLGNYSFADLATNDTDVKTGMHALAVLATLASEVSRYIEAYERLQGAVASDDLQAAIRQAAYASESASKIEHLSGSLSNELIKLEALANGLIPGFDPSLDTLVGFLHGSSVRTELLAEGLSPQEADQLITDLTSSHINTGTAIITALNDTTVQSLAKLSGEFANVAANIAPVPEPETYAMLVTGLGLLGFIAWRKNSTG
jgi:hypothetical protein